MKLSTVLDKVLSWLGALKVLLQPVEQYGCRYREHTERERESLPILFETSIDQDFFKERSKMMGKSLTIRSDFGCFLGYHRASKEDVAEVGDCCSICQDTMSQPLKLRCKHIFCEECIGEWLERDITCPLCRCDFYSSTPLLSPLSPSYSL